VNILLESQRHAIPEIVSSESVGTQEAPGLVGGSPTGGEEQPLDAPAIDAAAFDELGLA
jgi:hypothetical protein